MMRFAAITAFFAAATSAASLQRVNNFGPNPSGAEFYLYVPDKLANPAPLIVGIHWCSGTAQAYYDGTKYARVADEKGFIVIYPSAVTSDHCWDVASNATLTHLGGGDSLAIHSMVQYVRQNYNIDSNKIFATGTSSGAMMTQVLMGAYPDVFAAGSSWAGVPFGCFAGPYTWSMECSTGVLSKTAQQWGDQVRAAYPGYNGKRPKVQLFHGSQDEALSYNNHLESIKQWTNVLGLSSTPTTVQENTPRSGWTKSVYGQGQLEAVVEWGVTHNLVVVEDEALRFFGLQ